MHFSVKTRKFIYTCGIAFVLIHKVSVLDELESWEFFAYIVFFIRRRLLFRLTKKDLNFALNFSSKTVHKVLVFHFYFVYMKVCSLPKAAPDQPNFQIHWSVSHFS